jgi:hypothetical protein
MGDFHDGFHGHQHGPAHAEKNDALTGRSPAQQLQPAGVVAQRKSEAKSDGVDKGAGGRAPWR